MKRAGLDVSASVPSARTCLSPHVRWIWPKSCGTAATVSSCRSGRKEFVSGKSLHSREKPKGKKGGKKQ
ncbi:MAG: hypothetical protein IKN52_13130 [Victivallales bacterium]|nr:hypothetical protein [Victivallales bacterium]